MHLNNKDVDLVEILENWFQHENLNKAEEQECSHLLELLMSGVESGELPYKNLHVYAPWLTRTVKPFIVKNNIAFGDITPTKYFNRPDLIKFVNSKNVYPQEDSILRKWFNLEPSNQNTNQTAISPNHSTTLEIDTQRKSVKKNNVDRRFSNFENLRSSEISLVISDNEDLIFVVRRTKICVSADELKLRRQSFKILQQSAIDQEKDLTLVFKRVPRKNKKTITVTPGMFKSAICRLRGELTNALGVIDPPVKFKSYMLSFKTITHETNNKPARENSEKYPDSNDDQEEDIDFWSE